MSGQAGANMISAGQERGHHDCGTAESAVRRVRVRAQRRRPAQCGLTSALTCARRCLRYHRDTGRSAGSVGRHIRFIRHRAGCQRRDGSHVFHPTVATMSGRSPGGRSSSQYGGVSYVCVAASPVGRAASRHETTPPGRCTVAKSPSRRHSGQSNHPPARRGPTDSRSRGRSPERARTQQRALLGNVAG